MSPHAHARLVSIQPRWARDVEGVEAVLAAKDLAPARRSLLRSDTARYPGDPVAVVVAVDLQTAMAGLQRVDVQYEGLDYLPPVPELVADSSASTESLERCDVLDRWDWRRGSVPGTPLAKRLVCRWPGWSRRPFEPLGVLVVPETAGGLRVHSSAVDTEGRFGSWLRALLGSSGARLHLEAVADGCPTPRRSQWEVDGLAALLALETKRPVWLGAPPAAELSSEATPLPADLGCQVSVEIELDDEGRPRARRVRAIVDAGARLEMASQTKVAPPLAELAPFPNEDWRIDFVASHRPGRFEAWETIALVDHLVSNLTSRDARSSRAGDEPGWRIWSQGPLPLAPLDRVPAEHELVGVGRSLGRWGTGWIAHEVALGLDVLEARPRVLRWRVRNASDVDARSIRAQIAAEVDWLWRQPDQDLLEYWPTGEQLPEISLPGAEGSRGLEEAGTFPGAAAAAYLDALQEILGERMSVELPLTATDLFDRLHPAG